LLADCAAAEMVNDNEEKKNIVRVRVFDNTFAFIQFSLIDG
jgi:hypothetical protein